jgi:hypothetical protein
VVVPAEGIHGGCLSGLFLIAPFTQNNPHIVSSHLAWYFFLWSNYKIFSMASCSDSWYWRASTDVLSAMQSVNKIIYSVKFVYSLRTATTWQYGCVKYYLCHSNFMSWPRHCICVTGGREVVCWWVGLQSGFMRFVWFNNTADTCINMIAWEPSFHYEPPPPQSKKKTNSTWFCTIL